MKEKVINRSNIIEIVVAVKRNLRVKEGDIIKGEIKHTFKSDTYFIMYFEVVKVYYQNNKITKIKLRRYEPYEGEV